MIRSHLAFGLLGIFFIGLCVADDKPQLDTSKLPPATARSIDFQKDIQPILAKSCVDCHGPEKQRGGLRLDSGIEAFKGGNSGVAIRPGNAKGSRLLHLVGGLDEELKMPPEGKKPLTTAEIGHLRAWIEQGAKWPKDGATAVAGQAKPKHWSFIAPKRPEVPAVAGKKWVRTEIDAFVLARLEAAKIAPSPEADRTTLIRRLSFDLLGLPPTLQEVEDFVKDSRPDAYERLVDRLLASPHYGERWGRHWLDLARYADSDGYEKDGARPYAWRYRNWVIDAINRDLPFDQFTIDQLAGDLLPNSTVEQKIATGFHRNTLTNKEGGVDQEQFRVEAVMDRVNTTGQVFLGVTMGCCQCHDHKYDPFGQREYYQLLAFFNSDREVNLPVPLQTAGKVQQVDAKTAVADYKKYELHFNQQNWENDLTPADLDKLPANISTIARLTPSQRGPAQRKELADYYATIDPGLAELKMAAADPKGKPVLRRSMMAQTLALGPARKTHVMIRGDFLRPGAEVQPGTPATLPPLKPTVAGTLRVPSANGTRSVPATVGDISGGEATPTPTRLDLARWIVASDNPLTARVAVNWMWQRYFGRGIVATLGDFGTQGEKPSHPELLDWLATDFIRKKWSMKALHRLIVTSATYRQSSRVRPELKDRDPLNILLARQNRLRLEGEIVRDAALASGGLLVRTIGGPSVRPPQPTGVAEVTFADSARWIESTGSDRYRRGLYTWFQRTSPYPMLMTFDAPDSNTSCVRRERSNTPLQALTLMNDATFVECAQWLIKRMFEESGARSASKGATEARIRHGFRLCLAREPTAAEVSRLVQLHKELLSLCRQRPEEAAKLVGQTKLAGVGTAETAAWVALARAIMNLDEFVTRE